MLTAHIKRGSHAQQMVSMIKSGNLIGVPRECADKYLRIAHPQDKRGKFANIQRLRLHYRPLYNKLLATAIAVQWGKVNVID